MENVIELNSKDNVTKAEVVKQLIFAMTTIKKERVLRLRAYIEFTENQLALQLAELNKLYLYLHEVEEE